MSSQETVARFFELAIELEKSAEGLYRDLETRFAHHSPAADFWRTLAADEAEHAVWLDKLRDATSSEKLSTPADARMLENARQALQFCNNAASREINDLEEAFQLANVLEDSEMNVIFEFLITHYSADEKSRAFLRNLAKTHVSKLKIEFPAQFGPAARREIKA